MSVISYTLITLIKFAKDIVQKYNIILKIKCPISIFFFKIMIENLVSCHFNVNFIRIFTNDEWMTFNWQLWVFTFVQ